MADDFESDTNAKREDHRFVVRLWRERSASPPAWRGTVYDVSSALGIASCKLRDLWDFIMLRLGDDVRRETPHDE